MLDIKFVRENAEAVRENIRKKYQEEKLPLVDKDFRLKGLITIKDIEKAVKYANWDKIEIDSDHIDASFACNSGAECVHKT